jgi:hypothetical protein
MYDHAYLLYLLSEITSYVMAGGAGYLGWRLVRAYERRTTAVTTLSELRGRMKALEDVVEQLDETLGQTVEAQQFTTRLLLSRAPTTDERRQGPA